MDVIVTDLDGTLLDHDTYSFAGALGALSAIRDTGTRLVLCSSKTRAEMEYWREFIGARGPYVVENGGAVIWEPGYFPGGDCRLELGSPYAELRKQLAEAAKAARVQVRGFGDMDAAEISKLCGLPLSEAELAREREYDEPFVVVKGKAEDLTAEIEKRGWHWSRGGRFFHIVGENDKGVAVEKLLALFAAGGEKVHSLGLGDGLNDASFLKVVDEAVLMPSKQVQALRKLVPKGRVAAAPGSWGWNRAVIEWIGRSGDFWDKQN